MEYGADISEFEAIKFYAVYRKELDKIEEDVRRHEEKVDFVLAMATSFFLTSWVLVALRTFGIL